MGSASRASAAARSSREAAVTCAAQLLRRDAQVAAVEIDRRAADLLDEGARQPPRQMLAAGLVDLAREALAQLLRGGGDRD